MSSSVLTTNSLQFTGPSTSVTLIPTANNLLINNSLVISGTQSTSSTTGALTIPGGLGVANSSYVGGAIFAESNANYYILTSAANQSATNGVQTEVTTYFNGGQTFSNGTVITNPSAGRLQVSASGAYLYTSTVLFSTGSAGARETWIGVNGLNNNDRKSWAVYRGIDNTIGVCTEISAMVILNANDYISTYIYQSSGGTMHIQGSGSGLYTSLIKLN